MIASGEAKGVQGVTRNPDLVKEVPVSFGTVAGGDFGPGDVLSVRLLAKVADSGGHASAVGLRAYYYASTRPSRFGTTFDTTPSMTVQIVITSPTDGSVLPDPAALVEGTVAGPPGTSVTLTLTLTPETQAIDVSLPAEVSQGRFAAWTALTPGPVRIRARATAPTGEFAECVASVTVQLSDPALDQWAPPNVSPTAGFAPLGVTFEGAEASAPEVTVLDLDVDSDGRAEFSLVDFAPAPHRVTHTYTTEGLYIATITVRDRWGVSRRTRVPINVVSRPDLPAVWDVFRAALERGDATGALSLIASEARERYRRVFDDLAGDLPSLAADLGFLTLQALTPEEATGSMTRARRGVSEGFLVHFIRDGDGVWRIASM